MTCRRRRRCRQRLSARSLRVGRGGPRRRAAGRRPSPARRRCGGGGKVSRARCADPSDQETFGFDAQDRVSALDDPRGLIDCSPVEAAPQVVPVVKMTAGLCNRFDRRQPTEAEIDAAAEVGATAFDGNRGRARALARDEAIGFDAAGERTQNMVAVRLCGSGFRPCLAPPRKHLMAFARGRKKFTRQFYRAMINYYGFTVAEGAGFEPAIRFPVYTLSRRAPSTTRPPLRCAAYRIIPAADAIGMPRDTRRGLPCRGTVPADGSGRAVVAAILLPLPQGLGQVCLVCGGRGGP